LESPGGPRHVIKDYRPDIDGLRAVAVLAVIAFHAGASTVPGGFSGVDVFFVISGYLISGLVLPQIEKGTFSFAQFYVRRINRIFPALLLVIAATFAIGWMILVPGEFRQLGTHIVGGSTFSSNFVLWREAGYFDSPDKPLLHLWSLAVEEQFYLIWPALALFVWKRRLSVRWTVIVLIVASFALNAWAVMSSRGTTAFYSPVMRFWEIMAGALLVHSELGSRKDPAVSTDLAARNALSVIGTALVVVPFAVLNRDTPWPGWWAALPVIGTVLIIAAGKNATINRHVLSNRAVVYVGLISYPLYLWHWPLIVFTKLLRTRPPSASVMSVVVAISFILAILTYHFVEKPIRFGAHKARSARILLGALVLAGVVGFAAQRGAVAPRINGDSVARIESAVRDWTYPGEGGFDSDGRLIIHTIPGDTSRRIIILGDSHGEQYWPRMVELARQAGGRQPEIDFITYGGCTPFPNAERNGLDGKREPFKCRAYHRKAIEAASDSRVRTVVYSFWWEANFNYDRYLPDVPGKPQVRSTGPDSMLVFQSLQQEIQRLRNAGKNVFIVLSNPQSVAYNPTSLLPGRLPFTSKYKPVKAIPRSGHEGFASFTNSHLREIAAATGAVVITPADYLCTKTECPTVDEKGNPLYKDGNHMRASFVRDHATFIDRIDSGN
jgi:peptidoglycan/LPS O-acetylase OafA/YrhL